MENNEEIMNIIGDLEDKGIIQWHGMQEDDAVFAVDMEKLKDEIPMLYDSIIEDMLAEIDEALLSLYQKGLISVSWDENLVPQFSITEAGEEAYRNSMGNLEDL